MHDYFSDSICKTIVCQIPIRPKVAAEFEQGVVQAQEMLKGLDFVVNDLAKQESFFTIMEKLQLFSEQPKNVLVKSYLDVNIFAQEQKYFGRIPISSLLVVSLYSLQHA